MQFLTLKKTKKTISKIHQYRIDWNSSSLSKFQKTVKDFLYPYWKNKVIYEELPVVGSRMTLDFYNATDRIAIEVQGAQHFKYNKFLHQGNIFNFSGQLTRDLNKEKYCEINEIFLVEVFPDDVLSYEYFKNKGITLK